MPCPVVLRVVAVQVVKVTGVQHPGRTMSILIRGSNKVGSSHAHA